MNKYSDKMDPYPSNDINWMFNIWSILIGVMLVLVLLSLDIFFDFMKWYSPAHMIAEVLSVLMLFGLVFYLVILLLRTRQLAKQWQAEAQRAESESLQVRRELEDILHGVAETIEKQFARWSLTEAEREVGLLMLKGLSFKEIADIRQVSESTIRQQATTLYKKSGTGGRSEFSAYFLEDLLLPLEPNRHSD